MLRRKIAGRDWNRQKWTWKLQLIKDGKSGLLGERTREKKASELPMEASGTSAMNCLGRTERVSGLTALGLRCIWVCLIK